ncbi:hypothetical protein, conserved [Eimeria brunetti]|uniref:Uncharacterized protein n=1 Tax=Eimeria brunetti TaxID=51314 RepID=U6LMV9_9EIME|nr:hypothetical protein, conserved [Eimeria brunetti]
MLLRSGAFAWRCNNSNSGSSNSGSSDSSSSDSGSSDSGSSDSGSSSEDKYTVGMCTAQREAVQFLFACSYAAHFTALALGGLLVDVGGPKVTALLGAAMRCAGWSLLGFSSLDFCAYIPSMLFIGGGSGMTYISLLCVASLFPGAEGFCLMLLGSATSLSLVGPSVISSIHSPEGSVAFNCLVYAASVIADLLVVGMLVPLDGFIGTDLFVLIQSINSNSIVAAPIPQQQQQQRMQQRFSTARLSLQYSALQLQTQSQRSRLAMQIHQQQSRIVGQLLQQRRSQLAQQEDQQEQEQQQGRQRPLPLLFQQSQNSLQQQQSQQTLQQQQSHTSLQLSLQQQQSQHSLPQSLQQQQSQHSLQQHSPRQQQQEQEQQQEGAHRHSLRVPLESQQTVTSSEGGAHGLSLGRGGISTVTDDDFFRSFCSEASSLLYIGMCIYFCFCGATVLFYIQRYREFLYPVPVKAFRTAAPIAAILCIAIGRV